MNQALPMVYLVHHAAWTLTGQHIDSTDLLLTEQEGYEAHPLGASRTALSIDCMLSSHLPGNRLSLALVRRSASTSPDRS